MKIVKAGYEILDNLDGEAILKKIERIARVCYKSEDKITEGSAEKMVASLIKRGHEAMLEHYSFSVKFICDRGVSHELVRHRVASFAQESTRYCNYGHEGEITVIFPLCLISGPQSGGAVKKAGTPPVISLLRFINPAVSSLRSRWKMWGISPTSSKITTSQEESADIFPLKICAKLPKNCWPPFPLCFGDCHGFIRARKSEWKIFPLFP